MLKSLTLDVNSRHRASTNPTTYALTIILLQVILANLIHANSRILPTRAINYTRYLSKQDFDSIFPGTILQSGKTPQEPGYYVVYQHEKIIYYFGPESSEIAAELYLEDLDNVVDLVKTKRASLQSAKIDIQKFPKDLSTPKPTSPQDPDLNQTENPMNIPSPSQSPELPTPWWQKVLQLIGF